MSSKDKNIKAADNSANTSESIKSVDVKDSKKVTVIKTKKPKEKLAEKNSSTKAPKNVLTKYEKQRTISGYVFIAPLIIGFIFIYGEILLSALVFSLTEFKFNGTSYEIIPFSETGRNVFYNYYYIFRIQSGLIKNVSSSVVTMLKDIPIVIFFSLFVATILSSKIPGRGFFRAIFFIPAVLVTGVIIESTISNALLNKMQSTTGIVTGSIGNNDSFITIYDMYKMFGSGISQSAIFQWVCTAAMDTYQTVNKCGVQILIFISALLSISPSLYESAKIEGASGWDCYWKITVPMLGPMIYVNVIYTIVEALVSPKNPVMTMMTAFRSSAEYDHAAAASISYFIVIAVIIGLFSLAMKKIVFYQTND